MSVRVEGMDEMLRAIERVISFETNGTLDVIGAVVESQTRRRLQDEKSSPDGVAWQPWTKRYARTRHGNHSLLQSDGPLIDSIRNIVTGGTIEVGSPMVYAPVHQLGSKKKRKRNKAGQFAELGPGGTPAREYLGISPENESDIYDEIEDHLRGVLAAA